VGTSSFVELLTTLIDVARGGGGYLHGLHQMIQIALGALGQVVVRDGGCSGGDLRAE